MSAPLATLAAAVVLLAAVPAVAHARQDQDPQPLPGIPDDIVVRPGGPKPCADPCRRTQRADVAGGARSEIVTTTSSGPAPSVIILDAATGEVIETIHPFGSDYRGDGMQVATGDVDGDGKDEIVAAAGAGAAPRVRIFDGATGKVIHEFLVFDPSFIGGVNVAVGNVDDDIRAEIVVGAGPGGGPDVRVFDWRGQLQADFFAYVPSYRGGVRVSVG